MTDQNPTQTPTDAPTNDDAVEPTRLQAFVIKHPRASRVLAIGGAVGTVAGVSLLANNLRKNRDHIAAAGEHVAEAVGEFSEAVSPTSQDTDR